MSGVAWKGGAKCAVMVTVNLDAEFFWLALSPDCINRPKPMSMGQYGMTRDWPRSSTCSTGSGSGRPSCARGGAETYPDAMRGSLRGDTRSRAHGYRHEIFAAALRGGSAGGHGTGRRGDRTRRAFARGGPARRKGNSRSIRSDREGVRNDLCERPERRRPPLPASTCKRRLHPRDTDPRALTTCLLRVQLPARLPEGAGTDRRTLPREHTSSKSTGDTANADSVMSSNSTRRPSARRGASACSASFWPKSGGTATRGSPRGATWSISWRRRGNRDDPGRAVSRIAPLSPSNASPFRRTEGARVFR